MNEKPKVCSTCRFWSQMVAFAEGAEPIKALCLSQDGSLKGKYTTSGQTCNGWKHNKHGQVDDPPNYGEVSRELYERDDNMRYQNGNPLFDEFGMMLDDQGNRSIFDDVDD